jgi:predicted nucleic acid-binding protein
MKLLDTSVLIDIDIGGKEVLEKAIVYFKRGCPTITRQSIDNIPRAHIKTNSSSQHIDTL